MFLLYANKTQLTVRKREPITSGSVNVYRVRFEFSDDWQGLTRTAVFKSGSQAVSVLLDETGECAIPWEVTDPDDKGKTLYIGVYGTKGGAVVLPTVWASCGTILEGVSCCGSNARPPAPDLWQQALDRKGDRLGYTDDGDLGLYAGDKLLSSVAIEGGGGEYVPVPGPPGPKGDPGDTPHIGGNGNWWIGDTDTGVTAVGGSGGGSTTDHRELSNREAPEQHPISAIANLTAELSKRLTEDNAMSVIDIIKILED